MGDRSVDAHRGVEPVRAAVVVVRIGLGRARIGVDDEQTAAAADRLRQDAVGIDPLGHDLAAAVVVLQADVHRAPEALGSGVVELGIDRSAERLLGAADRLLSGRVVGLARYGRDAAAAADRLGEDADSVVAVGLDLALGGNIHLAAVAAGLRVPAEAQGRAAERNRRRGDARDPAAAADRLGDDAV